ncbi:hypothetical protein M3193_07290 [Sporosarcina luteola]|uniref:hypothetical protein n=1 Tax=Sporosarcina luteola TaxID=582850 RepID=UPI00203BD175|nr:hypothetical protein [Sporosarcina luteola]MCM3743945.1 hypothetical protein [Sporosarcina luteola]
MKDNRFQTKPNDEKGKAFTGMPNAKQFPDLEPEQEAEKQMAQFKNSTGCREEPTDSKWEQ